jgi:spermidine/putrescine transport system substrate-binding protein
MVAGATRRPSAVASLVDSGRRGRVGRGAVIGRRAMLGSGALSLIAAAAACTDNGSTNPVAASDTSAPSGPDPSDKSLVWVTWPGYMDTDDDGKRPTLDAFTAQTGIAVDYRVEIEDNEIYVQSIRGALTGKRTVRADIMTLTTWMAAKLAREGVLRTFGPLTAGKGVIPALARPDWDPKQDLSLPWQAGLSGIAYDARKVNRAITSIGELFTRADLKGRVGLLTEFNDTIGLVLLGQGKDVTTANKSDVDSAIAFVEDEKARGQVRGFYGNSHIDALADGSVTAAFAWSGDVLQAQADNPYLKFVVPDEGTMIWADNLVVPAGSNKAALVAQLAEYYYRPEIAARVAAFVNYICPVEGARAAMERVNPDLADSPLIFPDSSVLDRAFQMPKLEDEDKLRATFATVTR